MPLRRRGTLARRHPRCRTRLPEARHASFEKLVERALAGLPPVAHRLLEEVAIVVEDEPTREQLAAEGLAATDTLYGLYEGTPIIEYGADWATFPNKISLFRLPLEEDFPEPAELAREVRRTVLHELAHHAGIDDGRLHELDLD